MEKEGDSDRSGQEGRPKARTEMETCMSVPRGQFVCWARLFWCVSAKYCAAVIASRTDRPTITARPARGSAAGPPPSVILGISNTTCTPSLRVGAIARGE